MKKKKLRVLVLVLCCMLVSSNISLPVFATDDSSTVPSNKRGDYGVVFLGTGDNPQTPMTLSDLNNLPAPDTSTWVPGVTKFPAGDRKSVV